MTSRNKHEGSTITINQAVQALSSIADLDIDFERKLTAHPAEIYLEDELISSRSAEWLQGQDLDATVDKVKDMFHVILNYLRRCYRKESNELENDKTIEGIKNIMLLVGEAAKKLDRYAELITGKKEVEITKLDEYKKLQDFYQKKIAKRIESHELTKWVTGLAQATFLSRNIHLIKETYPTEHVFVDFDSVKKDGEYELLLMRKEDGTRFFNPRLLRNIKLVCEFGSNLNPTVDSDPFADIASWQDRACYIAAKNILPLIRNVLDRFYQHSQEHHDKELVSNLNMAMMALMLAANPRNQLQYGLAKNCAGYFQDFQHFLRKSLHCREYEQLIAYPPQKTNELDNCLLDLTQAVCEAVHVGLNWMQEFLFPVESLMHKAHQTAKTVSLNKDSSLWSSLAADFSAMGQLFKLHPHGPLIKIIDQLEHMGQLSFDSLMQKNLPNYWFHLHLGKSSIAHLRIPSPTNQSWIQRADVNNEFKAFISNYAKGHSKKQHLLINLQDRTSWREFARAQALEHLEHSDLAKHLAVATFAVDTEFYDQQASYEDLNHADSFIEQFKEHVAGTESGFHFSASIRKALFPKFVDEAMHKIHHFFFSGKNSLTKQNRLDFISLFYLFLELKLIDIVQPHSFSLTCKNCIDTGTASTALLFVFLKLLQKKVLSEADREYLNLILYGPSILVRERSMLPDVFHRMLSSLKVVEGVRGHLGHKKFAEQVQEIFGSLYHTDILHAHVTFPSVTHVETQQAA